MGSLVIRSGNLYSSEVNSKSKTANKKRFQHQHVPEEANELINNEGSSSGSTSHDHEAGGMWSSSSQGKLSENMMVSAEVGFIEQLKERLSSLEEEAESERQDFLQSVEERRKLMNEIYEQFQVIRCRRDKTYKEPRKGRGLTEVLWQENVNLSSSSSSSSSLVIIRDLKANAALLESSSTK